MTAEMADYFIQVEPNKDFEILQTLRALVGDQELDVDKVGGVHSLLRVVDVKADLLRDTLRNYSLQNLPSVQAAQSAQQIRQQAASVEKQEAKIEIYSGIQNEKQGAKPLTLAERIQKTQQERLNQREKRERGEAIQLDYGLGLNRQR